MKSSLLTPAALSLILFGTAQAAAPVVVFPSAPFADTVNRFVTHAPVVTGTLTSCSVSPNLPIGISVHAKTCVISGTPRFVTAASDYTIIAANDSGSVTTVVRLEVFDKNATSPAALKAANAGTRTTQGENARVLDLRGRMIGRGAMEKVVAGSLIR
jgi:hypothetical protein